MLFIDRNMNRKYTHMISKTGVLLGTLFLFCTSHAGDRLFYKKHSSGVKQKNLLFLHGTPGDHEVFEGYLEHSKLKENFNMISVDRLGFGKSQKKAELSFEKQNKAILKVIEAEFKNQRVTCVGHSYGGPLCLKLSIDHPEIFHKTVLVAGVFNPYRKILKWYNRMASIGVISWFLSKGLRNSNKEMYGLKKELIKLKESLPGLKSSTLLIHGRKDKIVPFEDSKWLSEVIPKDKFEFIKLKDAGHFVLWKQSNMIADEIIRFHH